MSGKTDEKCSYIPDERIKMQTAGRGEGCTFAGVHGGVDILGGFHKLPERTTIFRCYKLTAKLNLIYSKSIDQKWNSTNQRVICKSTW